MDSHGCAVLDSLGLGFAILRPDSGVLAICMSIDSPDPAFYSPPPTPNFPLSQANPSQSPHPVAACMHPVLVYPKIVTRSVRATSLRNLTGHRRTTRKVGPGEPVVCRSGGSERPRETSDAGLYSESAVAICLLFYYIFIGIYIL